MLQDQSSRIIGWGFLLGTVGFIAVLLTDGLSPKTVGKATMVFFLGTSGVGMMAAVGTAARENEDQNP